MNKQTLENSLEGEKLKEQSAANLSAVIDSSGCGSLSSQEYIPAPSVSQIRFLRVAIVDGCGDNDNVPAFVHLAANNIKQSCRKR
jgi:hypothetical protein